MVVRGARLEDTMSMYLVAQVQANDKIEVRLRSSVVAAKGDDHLAAISICQDGSPPEEVPTNWLFVYIGASPRTDWPGSTVARPEGLRPHRTGSARVVVDDAVAAGTRAVRPRDQCPRSVRRRRRAAGLDEARGVRGRRGRHGHLPRTPLPGVDVITAEGLRSLTLFEKVSEDEIRELIAVGNEVVFAPGDELWRQDVSADSWWVLLEGRIDLVRFVGHEETLLGVMDVPGRWAGGLRAWDDHAVYLVTGRASAPGRALCVLSEDLKKWTTALSPLGAHPVEGIFRTARTAETAARQRDALVALGTLSAGLAHELNNPAAAARRAVDALGGACDQLLTSVGSLASASVSAEQMVALDALRREIAGDSPVGESDPMARADREDALSDWLSDRGVEDAWAIAAPLASAGGDVEWCERAVDVMGTSLDPGLTWVVSTLNVSTLLSEVRESTRRISELVAAVKSYSQLDRASVQRTVLAEGLESTLVILRHRIPAGVTVRRDYHPDTPSIEAIPGELNQVWTNLITNALDAMGGTGTLRLSTRREREGVAVEIGDTGTWSAPQAKDRAFQPFFTTKGVGQGTGLGLDISRRIIVGRHRGDIAIDLRPGETVLRVWLPSRHGEGHPVDAEDVESDAPD